MLASGTAKLVAACVCPVVGVSALTLAVPKARSAVHDATAPKRSAQAKPRVRIPSRPAIAKAGAGVICPQPAALGGPGIAPTDLDALAELLGAANAGTSGSGAIGGASSPGQRTELASIDSPALGGGGGGFASMPRPDGGRTPGEDVETPDIGVPPPGEATKPVAIVPEPETWAQMLLGFGLLGGLLRTARYRRRVDLRGPGGVKLRALRR